MSRYKGRVSASAIERIFRMWSKLSCLRAVSDAADFVSE